MVHNRPLQLLSQIHAAASRLRCFRITERKNLPRHTKRPAARNKISCLGSNRIPLRKSSTTPPRDLLRVRADKVPLVLLHQCDLGANIFGGEGLVTHPQSRLDFAVLGGNMWKQNTENLAFKFSESVCAPITARGAPCESLSADLDLVRQLLDLAHRVLERHGRVLRRKHVGRRIPLLKNIIFCGYALSHPFTAKVCPSCLEESHIGADHMLQQSQVLGIMNEA